MVSERLGPEGAPPRRDVHGELHPRERIQHIPNTEANTIRQRATSCTCDTDAARITSGLRTWIEAWSARQSKLQAMMKVRVG